MLIADEHTITNSVIPTKDFCIRQSPMAFKILSTSLYSDPVLAIVRELLCNAYDAQAANGNPEEPIFVQLPNYLDNNFIIRDYGTGLSPEDVETLYTTFFWSTKSESNDFTGGFGLGSKTPFAYADVFTVITYFNGTEYKYACIKKDGMPSIMKVSTNPTEERNGLKITIPVRDNDSNRFRTAFNSFIKYMDEIHTTCERPVTKVIDEFTEARCKAYEQEYNSYSNVLIYIKQGQNVYSVPLQNQEYWDSMSTFFKRYCREFDLVFTVPIGTIPITPSREQLDSSPESKIKIKKLIQDLDLMLESAFVKNIKKYVDSEMMDLVNEALEIKYFKHIKTDKLISFMDYRWTNDARFTRYLKGKLSDEKPKNYTNRILPNTKTLIVINDDFKSRGGFKKFQAVVDQHESELTQYEEIMLLSLDSYMGSGNLISKYRRFCDAIKILNSITEITYTVDCISFTKFLRKYPYKKAARGEKKANILPENIGILACNIPIYRLTYSNAWIHMCQTSLSEIKNNWLLRTNGVHIAIDCADDEIAHFTSILQTYQNVFYNYIEDKIPDIKADNCSFIRFKKAGLASKSGFPVITLKEFLDYLKDKTPVYINIPWQYNMLRHFISMADNKNIFNRKEQEYIKKTNLYAYACKVSSILEKYDECEQVDLDTLNMYRQMYAATFQNADLLKKKFIQIPYRRNDKLDTIVNILRNLRTTDRRSKYKNYNVRELTTQFFNLLRSF